MTELKVFKEDLASMPQIVTELELEITELLMESGVNYQKPPVNLQFVPDISPSELSDKLQSLVAEIPELSKYPYSRLMALDDEHDSLNRMRLKYLSEHQKDQAEAYLVIDGQLLFNLHIGDQVFQLRCEKGDFIDLPAEIKRWIDFGQAPQVKLLKLNRSGEDAVTAYTGDKIADYFPRLQSE